MLPWTGGDWLPRVHVWWAVGQVAICVRTKDYGRFLPEWIAYHYVIGVDEIVIYDDMSTDGTYDIIRPFEDAGLVRYTSFRLGR